jgi:hypothetical protein
LPAKYLIRTVNQIAPLPKSSDIADADPYVDQTDLQ